MRSTRKFSAAGVLVAVNMKSAPKHTFRSVARMRWGAMSQMLTLEPGWRKKKGERFFVRVLWERTKREEFGFKTRRYLL